MITLLIFSPGIAAVLAMLLPESRAPFARCLALIGSLVTLILTLRFLQHLPTAEIIWTRGSASLLDMVAAAGADRFQGFSARAVWLPSLGVEYHAGIDGVNAAALLLISLLGVAVVLASWHRTVAVRAWFALIGVQMTAFLGTLTALNSVQFLAFWLLSLVPAFVLIDRFGGDRRRDAAGSFLAWNVAGAVLLAVGLLRLSAHAGTYDFLELATATASGSPPSWALAHPAAVFWMIVAGLAVRAGVVPLQSWVPEVASQAPAGANLLLVGGMPLMSLVGFLRIAPPILPAPLHAAQPLFVALALATLWFGAFAALRQIEIRKLLGYVGIAQIGLCFFGAANVSAAPAEAMRNGALFCLQGVILTAFAGGLALAGLYLAADLLERRAGSGWLTEIGGLRASMPRLAGLLTALSLAAMGAPFFAGFAGMFLILSGGWEVAPGATLLVFPPLLGIGLALGRMLRGVLGGTARARVETVADISGREAVLLGAGVAVLLATGLFPQSILRWSLGPAYRIVALSNAPHRLDKLPVEEKTSPPAGNGETP